MEVTVANQRILMFGTQISFEDAQQKAWNKKVDSFGTINKIGSFLSQPKNEDFELVYKEHRFEPFWHVVANARYVYDRNTNYEIKVSGPEVKQVNFLKNDYEVKNDHFDLPVLEHCVQEEHDEVLVDGITGKNKPELKKYLSLTPKQVIEDISTVSSKDIIMIPPQSRISAIMRDSLAKMIKGIQADKIIEETVRVEYVDLYYRPVYAFKYLWKSKEKEAIVEIDGLTGEVATGARTFHEYFGKILDQNFLFDLGADAAGMIIPGGSIAVKIAKKYVDTRKKK
ncbi:hypothetical protein A2V49_00830 [candidate division WWE3 bacterium RBG_19FT_COMBO_34_6]|uniref:Uncharacterized protein n=1 Tax=candidate division WWE3 bacterium RBG_19FT_COMBO_34_6 TaxID=1802612 RepID=A0A1F4UK97_UNCKA|nr:MAG: hypothetical protein A2V49_00830 [candidate division WWE3 bacterium RBG_19FT_COMBO_34_6]